MSNLVCKTLKEWQELGRSFDRDSDYREQKEEQDKKHGDNS